MRMRVECHERRPDHSNLNAVPYQPCVANILFKEERVSRPCEWRSCHREEKTPPQRGGGRFAKAGRWTASSPLPSRERTHPCFRFRAPISLSGKHISPAFRGSRYGRAETCLMIFKRSQMHFVGETLTASYPVRFALTIRNQGWREWQRVWVWSVGRRCGINPAMHISRG